MDRLEAQSAIQTLDAIRVLIVDDEPSVSSLTAEFLQQEDERIETVVVRSAAEGLEKLDDTQVDCIVSDYDMPEMNGLEFLESVRSEYPRLPFILFTGKGSEEIADKAISKGVTDYLQKGTSPDQYTVLANRVQNAVGQYRAQRAAQRQTRILDLTRKVNQSLVRAASRAEIETTVCEILTADDTYDAACFGRYDADESVIKPAAATGVQQRTLDVVSLNSSGDGPEASLIERAIERGEPQVSTADARSIDLLADESRDWPAGTVTAVPLGYQETTYGVLVLYSTATNPFDEAERVMLTEIADDIGHAIHAITLRETLRLHQSAVETVPDGIFVLDEEATIELVNQSAAALADLGPADLQGESFQKLIDTGIFEEAIVEWYLDGVRELLSSATDTDNVTLITEISPVTGPTRLVEVRLTLRDFDDEFRGTVGTIRDITQEHETRQELEQKNERLDQFASVVSHDLRNPISIGLGQLELFQETGDESHLDAVKTALERIHELTQDLTYLARLEPAANDRERVSLEHLANDAWAMTDTGSATLSTEPGTIECNPSQLKTLLENLFRNAVEHGGTDVSVRVGPLEDGFFVEDTGDGVPPEERDQVFAHGYTTGTDSGGYGLTIVSQIAEGHGWERRLTESAEGGARFEFHGGESTA